MTKAIILAGGLGTRLRPITKEIPKPLLPVRGRAVVSYLLETFILAKIFPVLVTSFADREIFKKVLLNIQQVCENKPNGTLKGIMAAYPIIEGDEYFFYSNGDELKDFEPLEMLEQLKSQPDLAGLLVVAKVKNTDGYGTVKFNSKNIISRFGHKTEKPVSKWIDAGLGLFRTQEFMRYLGHASHELDAEGEPLAICKVMFPLLCLAKKLGAYKLKGQFFTIDTPDRYNSAIDYYKPK